MAPALQDVYRLVVFQRALSELLVPLEPAHRAVLAQDCHEYIF